MSHMQYNNITVIEWKYAVHQDAQAMNGLPCDERGMDSV